MSADSASLFGTNGEREQFASDREEFSRHDLDSSGGLSEEELRKVLVNKRYTPLREVLDEILDEIYDGDWDPESSELQFEEYFDFMLIFEQRDGFTKAQVRELRTVYDRFDEDNSGEVSVMECAELFRYVGYRVTLEDLRDHVMEVDENGSGQLDFREFLRLMRLYREKELHKIRTVFDKCKDQSRDQMPVRMLEKSLVGLGHDPPFQLLPGMEKQKYISFDDMVAIADSCRSAYVAKERKKAGFSDEEIEHFQEIYKRFDLNKNGEIDNLELQNILKEFGWQPRSREQQTELMNKIDNARALAREAGVQDVGSDGSPTLRFWTFIQLARMCKTEEDKASEAKLRELQHELKFTEGEVEDFRQVFRSWVKRSFELEGRSPPKPQDNVPETLSREMIRRLMRSLGTSLSPSISDVLDSKIQSLDEESRLETAELGFSAFLQLMRWTLDTNFAGVNDATASSTEE